MPHATADMGDATVNGDMPESSFIKHVTSYPMVADCIKTVQNNPYGQRGIDITNSSYSSFVKPVLPYFQTPYSYTKPYIAKVDQLGDAALSKFDEKIPILKSETHEIKDTAIDYAHFPIKKAGESKDWVLGTYSNEYKKCGGDGYVAGGKALITSSLILGSDVLGWLSSFLSAKKDEAATKVQEKTQS